MRFLYDKLNKLKVSLKFSLNSKPMPVGTLVLDEKSRERKIYFQYDAAFIRSGLPLSPVHPPLEAKLFEYSNPAFENLPGVFYDSLPDGWGRLLCDRFARQNSIDPASVTALERLAYIGKKAMGALIYEPAYDESAAKAAEKSIDLNVLAKESKAVLEGSSDDVLQELLDLNGSLAGARPKALIGVSGDYKSLISNSDNMPEDFTPWLVKFPNERDGKDAGAIEYVYALMAEKAGIAMPETHLFPARSGAGFFAVKRFDREGRKRLHTHTAAGLLHSNFRAPSLDYRDIMALTQYLTKDMREVEKIYRLAVFNVLAHNRDDHGKNFTFLMNEKGEWKVSPAYDLTFSSGPGGEQSMMVMGEGKNPGEKALLELSENFKLPAKNVKTILEQTQSALAQWPHLAKNYGVSRANISLIRSKFSA